MGDTPKDTQKRAFFSAANKTGLITFGEFLREQGYELWGTRGTAQHMTAGGVACTDIAELAGVPPILSHGVVSLQAQLHAGLRGDPDSERDQEEVASIGGRFFHLAHVVLYGLPEVGALQEMPRQKVREEKFDIGGRAALSMAIKGDRIVVAHPALIPQVTNWMRHSMVAGAAFRLALQAIAASAVEEHSRREAQYYNLEAAEVQGSFLGSLVAAKENHDAVERLR